MANFLTDATFAGNVNLGPGTNDAAGIRLIHPGSSENPEVRIQSGESGTTAISIYNTATSPDAEQFFVNNTLGSSHLGNKRGALKLETNSGVVLTLNGTDATFAGHVFVEDGNKFFGANAIAASSEDGNYVASFGKSTSGSAKFAGNITVGSGTSTFAGDVDLPDDKRLRFGNQDLQIFHSSVGTGSFIQESGPGGLEIYSDTSLNIKSGALGENFAKFTKDGPIELYYDNSKKFETTSAGITVTGNIVVSSTVDGRDVASDGSKLDGISANARTGTVTSVSVGTGLDIQNSTTTPSITVDLSELNDIDGDDPQITDFVVVSNEDESTRCSLANTKVALGVNKNQFVLNSNFSDDTSTTSFIYFPFNSLTDGTSSQYYRHWAAPCTGRIKRIIMQHTSGSMSSGFTTQLQVYKGSSTFATSSELTVTTTNDGGYIEYNPSGSDIGKVSFVKGDRIRIRFSKSATGKYWRGVAASIIIELDQV